jgi:translocation and assembly module TamB
MDQVKQLSYLLTGQDFDKPGESQDANTQLVNTLVSFGVGRSENGIGRLGRKLGVDNLNLQAAGVGEDTQVQISGRLSDKIQISYGLGVFDSVSEIKLRYDLLPDVYLEAVSGMQNALDLYYEIERQ